MAPGWRTAQRELSELIVKRRWVVTGAAGFIGSHLTEELLKRGAAVTGIDDLSTGSMSNLEDVRSVVGDEAWQRFTFFRGSVSDPRAVAEWLGDGDVVLHQAALGSVPRSISNPLATDEANVHGQLAVLEAARKMTGVRVVFASSSSVYGDAPDLPKREEVTGTPLSPYAVSKAVNELYAETMRRIHGLEVIALRYFNVFGPRQNPNGPYAAVIPKWLQLLLDGEVCTVYGDGETSRDFCYVDNVVQANVLAALTPYERVQNPIYNVSVGGRTSLRELHAMLVQSLADEGVSVNSPELHHGDFRAGDVRHSQASIERIRAELGFEPDVLIEEGVRRTVRWAVGTGL